jgi:hypothetical protein
MFRPKVSHQLEQIISENEEKESSDKDVIREALEGDEEDPDKISSSYEDSELDEKASINEIVL